MTVTDPAATSWHLDKRINVALIVALAGQAIGLIIWGTSLTGRVGVVEALLRARTPVVERFFQVEADLLGMRRSTNDRLDRIENKLDRLIENGVRPTPGQR